MDIAVGRINCYFSSGKQAGNMYEESSKYSRSQTIILLLGNNYIHTAVNNIVLLRRSIKHYL